MTAFFEIGAFMLFLLFAVIQIGMTIAAKFWNTKVIQWKTSLQNSRSTPAKLALTIFF